MRQRAVFVHGSGSAGELAWPEQQVLADDWDVEFIVRRGFDGGPLPDRIDFGDDAADLVALLADRPAHVVAHSYGALGALLAGERAPECTLSLCLIEPAAFSLARGHPAVEANIADGVPRSPERLARHRPPWEAVFATDRLRGRVPVLVVTGDGIWTAVYNAIGAAAASALDAERLVIRGHGHRPNDSGQPFNDALTRFWRRASPAE